MAYQVGDTVKHPETEESGEVLDIRRNPACLMRTLTIRWGNGEIEDIEEIEFGPLED